ncbi:hypothetical protein JCM10450v2_005779 [Rhodotorula kratochvilovae]
MPHTSKHLDPRPPSNWTAIVAATPITTLDPVVPLLQEQPQLPAEPYQQPPTAQHGHGQWAKGDGRPEPQSTAARGNVKWKLIPRDTKPLFNQPFLPTDVHPPDKPPIRLPNWPGFAVEALHLGTLDERQFGHFATERDVPLAQGVLEVKLGERKGDKVEPRGDVALSGFGFDDAAAVKIVFQAGSLSGIYYVRAPDAPAGSGANIERYYVVLRTRWTPRFFAYKPRADGQGVFGQVRVTALDARHAEKTSFLSRTFLLVLRLPRDSSTLGSAPTPFSFPDFLHACRAADLPTPIPLPALALLPLRAFATKLLERLDTALSTLSPTLAFHIEGMLRTDGTLAPSEALRLIDEHVKPWEATAALGDTAAEDILIELRTLLDEDRAARAQLVLLEQFFRPEVDIAPLSLAEWAEKARVHVEAREKVDLVDEKGKGTEHFWCRTVTVAPSGSIKVGGRVLEKSNAVIRRYYDAVDSHKERDYFLRVMFRDEDDRPLGPMGSSSEHGYLLDASVGRALKKGLNFGGRTYDFLAYSQSGLRDRSVWFAAPWNLEKGGKAQIVGAEAIRRRFGNFSKIERMPAKLGSRFSQGFTSSHATEVLHFNQISRCDDLLVLDQDGNEVTNHSDGSGLMSTELRDQVWQTLREKGFRRDQDGPPPSVYQIRLGGSKGILVVDAQLKGSQLQIRPSQDKFAGSAETEDGSSFCLNVADAWTRPLSLRLNRPLISALDDLGIETEVFLKYQKAAIDELQPQELQTLNGAYSAIHRFAFGQATRFKSLLRSLVELPGFPDSILREEPFLNAALQVIRVRSLRDLKDKASIPLPDSYVLVGVPDQDRILRQDDVFVALRFLEKPDEVVYLEGRIVVTRSPSTDPGDIRVLHAIGRPPHRSGLRLGALENCIVLPAVGERAIASTMGGGDLDGDTYQVITLPDLIPERTVTPRPYKGEPPLELDRAATIDDVADCLLKYLTSDSTGIIATNHLIVSDKSEMHGFDPKCQQLADLYGLAVDAPKTGNVVALDRMPDLPSKELRPDFLRKTDLDLLAPVNEDGFQYYRSGRALGFLYREIEDDGLQTPPAVHGPPALDDSTSMSCAYLRLSVESDLASLFDTAPDNVKKLPASLKDHLDPILAAFYAAMANLARVHSLPNSAGRTLSEVELFAVTSLLDSQRHEAARGSAIAAMARELAALVNWLERALSSAAAGHPQGQLDGETLRLRYSAWVLAVETGDEWTYGVRTARWVCLALLLESMRKEKARRDELAEFRSASEVHGPVFGQVAVPPPPQHFLQQERPQPTPPPSPPVARSGVSFPSSSLAAPAVPYASRPRTSAMSDPTSLPRGAAPAPLLSTDLSTIPPLPHPPPQHFPLVTPSSFASQPMAHARAPRAAADPWGVDLERRRRYTRQGEEPPSFDDPGEFSDADEDDDPGAFPAALSQPLPRPPWVAVHARGSAGAPSLGARRDALGAYGSSSEESNERERARAVAALRALEVQREREEAEPEQERASGAREPGADDDDEEELNTEEEAEAARLQLWEEQRRRAYLEGRPLPAYRPRQESMTARSTTMGGYDETSVFGATTRSRDEVTAPTTRPSATTTRAPASAGAQQVESYLERLAREQEEREQAQAQRRAAKGKGRAVERPLEKVNPPSAASPPAPARSYAPLTYHTAHSAYGGLSKGGGSAREPPVFSPAPSTGHLPWPTSSLAYNHGAVAQPTPQRHPTATPLLDDPTRHDTPPHLRCAPPLLMTNERDKPYSPPLYPPLSHYQHRTYASASQASEQRAGPSSLAEEEDDAHEGEEYEPPPTPPDKRWGYFPNGEKPFWANFDDRDKMRYKSNLSGEGKLGRYVVGADGRPYREVVKLGVAQFPERRGGGSGRWEGGSSRGGRTPPLEREQRGWDAQHDAEASAAEDAPPWSWRWGAPAGAHTGAQAAGATGAGSTTAVAAPPAVDPGAGGWSAQPQPPSPSPSPRLSPSPRAHAPPPSHPPAPLSSRARAPHPATPIMAGIAARKKVTEDVRMARLRRRWSGREG